MKHQSLDALWMQAAARMGLRVQRSGAAYAATDGKGCLFIGTDDTLDADDSLAQLIFHEICHWIVQGEAAVALPDWGLDNAHPTRDVAAELTCLQLQAQLADAHGLRALMRPTTPFAAYYDRLPVKGLPKAKALQPSCITAAVPQQQLPQMASRAAMPPWQPHLQDALEATRARVGAGPSVKHRWDDVVVAVGLADVGIRTDVKHLVVAGAPGGAIGGAQPRIRARRDVVVAEGPAIANRTVGLRVNAEDVQKAVRPEARIARQAKGTIGGAAQRFLQVCGATGDEEPYTA